MSNVDTSANLSSSAAPLLFPTWEAMEAYTETFRTKFKRNPSMSIEDANALLARVANEQDTAKMTADDWSEVFENAETDDEGAAVVSDVVKEAVQVARKHAIAIRAENLAADAAKDAKFTAFIDGLNEKKLDVERGPLETNFYLRRIYGERLKEFPLVGSKGGNNPDLYQGEYTKADGTKGTKEFSFYTAFAAALPSYQATVKDMEAIKVALSDKNAANVDARFKGKSEYFLKTRNGTLKDRLTNIKNLCVRAFVIEQNLARINSDMGTKVKAEFVLVKNEETGTEEPAPGIREPFAIGDWSNGFASFMSSVKTLNITKFTSLDIDKAIADGGTFDALMATIARSTKTKPETGMKVGTFDDLQAAFALSLGFIQTLKSSEQRTMLKAKIVSDKEGYLETVFDLKDTLNSLCADTDLQKVYARHMQAKLKKEAEGEQPTAKAS